MVDARGATPAQRPSGRTPVAVFVALLAVAAVVVTALLARADEVPPGTSHPFALPALLALLVAASLLVVRFRHGRDVDGVTLVEAVLAPLVWAFPGTTAVAVAVGAALVTAAARRSPPLKAAFNTAQWALAVAVGATVVEQLAPGRGLGWGSAAALVLGLVAIGVVNTSAFTTVVALSGRHRPATLLRALAPVITSGWLLGFGVNVVLGLLYVLAYESSPWAVLLFPVPLVVLHGAYRGYAAARSDRQRLAGLHAAAQALTGPLDPRDGARDYLATVADSFGACAALLVLRRDTGCEVHRLVVDGTTTSYDVEVGDPHGFASALLALHAPLRVERDRGALGLLLRDVGERDAVAAPLVDEGLVVGAVAVVDCSGVEGVDSGELPLMAALARETAGAFGKGRLLARMLEDRRRLEEIVGTTSDGILTLDPDGVVRSWNPALEKLTGLRAGAVVGVPGALAPLRLTTVSGMPVDLGGWAGGAALPHELRVAAAEGPRRVVCSYSHALDEAGDAQTLVVVARDVTPVQEIEELRAQFLRLVEAEAAQRVVVEHLQQAVMPPRPSVPGAELGVSYVASDPTSPTGGDLYDVQLLPSGELHLAVVDVVGHGVEATQDALSVAHTLRAVTFDGTPLEDVVARADELLGRQDPDLVATVVLARYDPVTAALRVVSGGHPPPMVVSPAGEVRELTAHGGAIGWPGAGSDDVVETVLAPGEALLLYTDGLVEARKDIVEGLLLLAEHARGVARLPAAELADALVAKALAGAERRDDTLALVLRRTPVATGPQTASWQIAPDPRAAPQTRRAATDWLVGRVPHVDEAALVLGELLANAVEVARTEVSLQLEVTEGAVRVEVVDDGPGFAGSSPSSRADGEHGRGLMIVRALADEVVVDRVGERTRVRVDLRP